MDTTEEKLRQSIINAINCMPGEDLMHAMATHAQHRVVVHFKLRDWLEELLEAIGHSYSKFPEDVQRDMSHKTRLVLSGWEELAECLIEMGEDTDKMGQKLIAALEALEEGLGD